MLTELKYADNLDEKITKRVNENIDYYDGVLNALKKIKRVYKKDGSDFKIMSKNFEGIVAFDNYYVSVLYTTKSRGYDRVHIYMGDDKRNFNYTADDVQKAIDDYRNKFLDYKQEEINFLKTYKDNPLYNEIQELRKHLNNKENDKYISKLSLYL